jgi:hypothetical protein
MDESKEYVVSAEKGMDASLEFLEKLGTFDKQLSSVLRSLRNDTAALLEDNKKKDDVISSLMADLSNRQAQLQEVEAKLKEIEAKEAQQKEAAAAAELNAVVAEISIPQAESPIRVYRLLTGSSETSTFANTVSVEVAEVKPEVEAKTEPEVKTEVAEIAEVKSEVKVAEPEAKTEVKVAEPEVKIEAPTVKEVKPRGGFCCRR